MMDLLQPEFEEVSDGQAQVRQIFSLTKRDRVAGCLVLKGRINSTSLVRVKRNREELFQGELESLRHYQEEVKEVKEAAE